MTGWASVRANNDNDPGSVTSTKLLRDNSAKSQWAEKLLTAAQMPFESVSTTDQAKLPILVFSSKQGIVELVGLPLIKACAQWFARAVVVSMLYNTAAEGLRASVDTTRDVRSALSDLT